MPCPNSMGSDASAISPPTPSPQPPRDVTEAQPQQDTSEAELVCYETYAALGNILLDLAEHGHPQAEKLLDNLSQAKLVHKDVLPFDHGNVGVGEVHPCPLGKGCQPDPNCTNSAQCWEPCGLLGNDEKHVRAASAKDTAAINKALGVPPCEAPSVDDLMELARQYAHAYFNHHTAEGSAGDMLGKTREALRAALARGVGIPHGGQQ